MAYSSSSLNANSRVHTCSTECEQSYAQLKKLYDTQKEQLGDANIEIQAYTQALKKKVSHEIGEKLLLSEAPSSSSLLHGDDELKAEKSKNPRGDSKRKRREGSPKEKLTSKKYHKKNEREDGDIGSCALSVHSSFNSLTKRK
ncbi:hypothetical protein Tco_0615928 [Tanacetum coccineum]